MYLKRLELVGFKSFAQKTVLDFPAGIAAVVGPNGSGKSNIIDAIRWLLGEREAKNMRSIRAEDLIFAGTPTKPRVGLAQAAIVFDNGSHFFPVDFNEVSIRRRLARDGTSLHLLNDAEVRLKDIIDFFAKSRMGTRGFSIINQGDSDLFVRATPNERREMLEEILGLRQFQIKKHDAELKLKSTKFNVEKAKALVAELMPHLKLLRRQTAKWEKHDDLKKELREFENQYFAVKLQEIETDRERLKPARAKIDEELNELNKALKGLESELERVEANQPKSGKNFSREENEKENLLDRKANLERELGRLEAQIEIFGSRTAEHADVSEVVKLLEETRETIEDILLENNIKRIKTLLQNLFEKINHILESESHEMVKIRPAELDATRDNLMKELEAIDGKLQSLKELEKETTVSYLTFNAAFKKAYETVEAKRHEIINLETQKNKLLFEDERINIRREELAHQCAQIGRRLEDFAGLAVAESNDTDVIEKRMLRLRGELAGMGDIDEGLVKEAKETETRYQFLVAQIADLEKSYNDLTGLIWELDDKIHKEFNASLNRINEEFYKYFRMMFGGGQAKLKIRNPKSEIRNREENAGISENQENGENPEPAGLDIELGIPRKRITGLDMLSGGEKSLVSLAVLFALISVSPPPFLVLDEVDAALDESNSKRFASLIKDFSKKTQFLVVTHNRNTMEAADILYGVTMGNDGTSRVLSLKLE